MRPPADAIVVGAGVLGAASARELAGRGLRTVLLERDTAGNRDGSSHGDVRMRVIAGFPDESYVERGLRAGEGWSRLERESGDEFLHRTGCLSWGVGQHELARALGRHGQRHELWSAADAARRAPAVRLPAAVEAIHQPDAATIRADWALAALLAGAVRRGADVRERTPVLAVEARADAARVLTADGWLDAGVVVLCAGPWTPTLAASIGIELDLRVTRQTVAYFDIGAVVPPGLIEYGAPDPYACWSPGRTLKAAQHAAGPETRPGGDRTPTARAVESIARWVDERFRLTRREPVHVETCLYTSTPDERFLLERRGPIVIGSACSGHGFQYAPDSAERLAALATGS